MKNSESLEKIIEPLKKIKGSCKGVSLQTPLEYVRLSQGEEVVKKIENELKKIGLPTRKEIKNLEYYPIGYMTIFHLLIKEILNWKDEDIKKMGQNLPQISFIAKTITKYFVSLKKVFENCHVFWERHFTIGELVPFKIDEEKKYLIIQLKNYKTHPVDCKLFEGYFARIVGYVIDSKKITIEETKCVFEGSPHHEYVVKWD